MTVTDVERPQPLLALARANEIRSARARAKQELAALSTPDSLARAADLVVAPPDELASMHVIKLLEAVRGMRTKRARRLLLSLRPPLGEHRVVGHLPGKRRDELAAALRAAAANARTERQRHGAA